MPPEQPDASALKRAAALRALDFVTDGMRLGLGSGTTAEAFVECLGPRVKGGLNIVCVPTSRQTAERARALAIPLAELDQLAPLDLVIDGADEADASLTLIKGGGGALLREKIVAASSKKMVVIADASKLVATLGKFPLPVEVSTFGHVTTSARIVNAAAKLGYARLQPQLRTKDGAPYKTDGGNYIYDCPFGAITDAAALAAALSGTVGVIDHGLFVGLATALVIAREDKVEVIER
jgi:ribose 5-phosphate isomerase A